MALLLTLALIVFSDVSMCLPMIIFPSHSACKKVFSHLKISQAAMDWRENPTLNGISLDNSRSDIVKILGKGKIVYRSPDYVEKKETLYEWKIGESTLEIRFNQENKPVFIGFFTKRISKSIGGIYLNKDTIESVRNKLGPPDRIEGPTPNEGELYTYKLIYLAGKNRSSEVNFISYFDASRTSLAVEQVTPEIFSKRAIGKVFISIREKD